MAASEFGWRGSSFESAGIKTEANGLKRCK